MTFYYASCFPVDSPIVKWTVPELLFEKKGLIPTQRALMELQATVVRYSHKGVLWYEHLAYYLAIDWRYSCSKVILVDLPDVMVCTQGS